MANVNATVPATSASTTTSTTTSVADNGKTVINDAVIAKITGIAVREVPGVYGLGGGAARAFGAIRNVVGNTDLSQGVSVEVGETQVAADVTIVAEYPAQLQKVANDVRAAAYAAIEGLIGMQVTEVNVTIVDVHLPGEDDKSDDSEARVQ